MLYPKIINSIGVIASNNNIYFWRYDIEKQPVQLRRHRYRAKERHSYTQTWPTARIYIKKCIVLATAE